MVVLMLVDICGVGYGYRKNLAEKVAQLLAKRHMAWLHGLEWREGSRCGGKK